MRGAELEAGREAYHRFGRVLGFRTGGGLRLPCFDELPRQEQAAWVAAGAPQNSIFIDDAGAAAGGASKIPSRYENQQ